MVPVKWTCESPHNYNYYKFNAEGIPSKSSTGEPYTKYLGNVDILERGFKYIFPRILGISLSKIFEMNKDFLLVELSYIRSFNRTTKAENSNPGDFSHITRTYKEPVRGFWRIYKDRLPERLDMRNAANKKWYKDRTGFDYQSDRTIKKRFK